MLTMHSAGVQAAIALEDSQKRREEGTGTLLVHGHVWSRTKCGPWGCTQGGEVTEGMGAFCKTCEDGGSCNCSDEEDTYFHGTCDPVHYILICTRGWES